MTFGRFHVQECGRGGGLLKLLDQQHFNFPTIADTAELVEWSLFKDHSSNLQSD